MLFEKEDYYNCIKTLEKLKTAIYAFIMFLCIIWGIASGIITLIITIPIGMFISYMTTFAIRVKIQEMKWKFDFYMKYIRSSN